MTQTPPPSLDYLQALIDENPEAVQSAYQAHHESHVDGGGPTAPVATPTKLVEAYQADPTFAAELVTRITPQDKNAINSTLGKVLRVILEDGKAYLSGSGVTPTANEFPLPSPSPPFNYKPWAIGGLVLVAIVLGVLALKK